VDTFWTMTPREVQLSIRATSDIRLDRLDELTYAAWHGALWGGVQRVKKLPDLKDAIARRKKAKAPASFEAEIRRWEIFFASTSRRKGN
jgi:hypothetical protein